MPHPCPHHCPPGRGSGLGIIFVAIVLIGTVAAIRSAMPAIEHTAEVAMEVLVITVASIAGLAAIGAASYVALRIRRSQATARQALASHTPAIQRGSQALSARRRRAIEASQPPLYVIRPEHRIKEEK